MSDPAIPQNTTTGDAIDHARAVRNRAEALGDRLPALLVEAERVAAVIAQGTHGRRRVGMGETFWQYRTYDTSDQVQTIDWRRSARSDSLFVRETEWEAAQSVWVWRDGSPSMNYKSDKSLPTKRDRADLLLLANSALLLRGGERIGLLGGMTAAGTGRHALRRIASEILLSEGSRQDLPDPVDLPRHSQVILFGDFLTDAEAVRQRIAAYADRRIKGVICQILDPAEETLPFRGRVRFSGLEEEGETLLSRVETLRHSYSMRLDALRDSLRDIARHTGWMYMMHRTDHPPEAMLMAMHQALSRAPRR